MYNATKPYKKQVLELIQQTWQSPYISVKKNIYPILERNFSYPEVDHTDGIGTKGLYHWQKQSFKNAVLDALAMNLNDLALVRAVPYKLQNHIFLPEDNEEAVLEIVETLVEECKKRKIVITGGETSIQNNMQGLDISIGVSGFIKNLRPNQFQQGDVVIGLRSSGLHSNGFTKVREIFQNEYRPEFIEPTLIYFDEIISLSEQFEINGMMHITGGAFTKIKGLLGNNDIFITRSHKLQPQPIFQDLWQKGIADEEMYQTFNCGIGFVFSISSRDAKQVISKIQLEADIIGEIKEGSGRVVIESAFSGKEIIF